jgi:formate dehydrogenase iron-sulfur subunit
MIKTPEGPVIYDGDKCMGCRYCMMACPYGIPRYDWEKPIPYVRKCDMCHERLAQGKRPACVEACPEQATIFGTREELLEEAHRRIAAEPGKYVDRVYGEADIGGTSVLYISDIALDFLAFKPELGDKPLPDLTWAALSKVPPLALGMGGLMVGIHWIVNRRMRIAAEQAPPGANRELPDQPDAPPAGNGANEPEGGQP